MSMTHPASFAFWQAGLPEGFLKQKNTSLLPFLDPREPGFKANQGIPSCRHCDPNALQLTLSTLWHSLSANSCAFPQPDGSDLHPNAMQPNYISFTLLCHTIATWILPLINIWPTPGCHVYPIGMLFRSWMERRERRQWNRLTSFPDLGHHSLRSFTPSFQSLSFIRFVKLVSLSYDPRALDIFFVTWLEIRAPAFIGICLRVMLLRS